MKKNTEMSKRNIEYIAKQISDGVYINVTRLPDHDVNFEKELEDSFNEEPNSNLQKPLRDKNEENGSETIGIP